jgi:hypothetical protein
VPDAEVLVLDAHHHRIEAAELLVQLAPDRHVRAGAERPRLHRAAGDRHALRLQVLAETDCRVLEGLRRQDDPADYHAPGPINVRLKVGRQEVGLHFQVIVGEEDQLAPRGIHRRVPRDGPLQHLVEADQGAGRPALVRRKDRRRRGSVVNDNDLVVGRGKGLAAETVNGASQFLRTIVSRNDDAEAQGIHDEGVQG